MNGVKFTSGLDSSSAFTAGAFLKSALDLLATMGEEAFEPLVALSVLKVVAVATMLSMLVYALFSRDLRHDLRHDLHGLNLPKRALVVGGLGAYLVFAVLRHLDWPGVMSVWLVPVSLVVLSYAIGPCGVHGRERFYCLKNPRTKGRV